MHISQKRKEQYYKSYNYKFMCAPRICDENMIFYLLIQVPTLDFLSEKLAQYMAQYNEMVRGGSLDLVFFKDAMIHLVKVRLKTSFRNVGQFFPKFFYFPDKVFFRETHGQLTLTGIVFFLQIDSKIYLFILLLFVRTE